ncbi:DUF4007 family protein [Mariprofundus erugo]|uniref:DUF4007 family protein n=1 Tax=Mariprofundus erugo TaxID=2528639 RepID=UPI0010FEBA86|nr:DUF4007 family protein [Mariprofundus erugo]TLS77927.1 DUF4007 family protein [Mariprofundus erugo]
MGQFRQNLTAFNAQSFSFGRHETFHLRYGWLTKGCKSLMQDAQVFQRDDSTVTLGVGKNMVTSIRYWLIATRMAYISNEGLALTELGHAIFSNDGWDTFLEDEATIWLIHWLLATNSEHATSIYWFFNKFHKVEFSSDELHSSLSEFVAQELSGKKVADTTLRHDCNMLTRLYMRSMADKKTSIEDALDSPLAMLELIGASSSNHRYISKPSARWDLPLGVLGFAVAELFQLAGQASLALEAIVHGSNDLPALGSVFRISEENLMTKLEQLISWSPETIELRETAGVNALYLLKHVDPISMLEKHYSTFCMDVAA